MLAPVRTPPRRSCATPHVNTVNAAHYTFLPLLGCHWVCISPIMLGRDLILAEHAGHDELTFDTCATSNELRCCEHSNDGMERGGTARTCRTVSPQTVFAAMVIVLQQHSQHESPPPPLTPSSGYDGEDDYDGQGEEEPEGFLVFCRYDFEAEDASQLSFTAGDILRIVQTQGNGWWAALDNAESTIGECLVSNAPLVADGPGHRLGASRLCRTDDARNALHIHFVNQRASAARG